VETERTDSITSGGLARPLFQLAWPIVVIQLLQVTYNIADTFWLGQYDVSAVAALSIAFPLVFLLISVAGGFTTAGSILVAQYTGADSEGRAGHVAGQTIAFVGLLAAVLGVVGYLFTGDMLAVIPSAQDTSEKVIPLANVYMEIIFLGVPFLFGFFVFSALMRGYGDTRTPMRIMFVSVALNVVLDPLLIFGWSVFPELGISGAAIATVISRGIATVLGLYVLFVARAGPDVRARDMLLELEIVRKIVRLGVPSSLEQSTSALALVTLTAMVVSFATPVVAAYGVGNRLISLVFLPAMGLGRATNTMVGQNLGANKTERAERAVRLAVGVGAGVMLAVGVVAYLFPEPIVDVFIAEGTPDARATVELGSEYLRIRAAEFAFIGVFQVLLGAYRGAGNTRTALAFSLVALWIGRVPTVYILAFATGMGATGIWIGMSLGNILGAIAAGAWFLRGTWKEAVIEADPDEPADDPSSDADVESNECQSGEN
jgi:putative MATE family efflux protein